MSNLRDKTILVTGATDGLGKGIVLALARGGATILVHGRDDDPDQILTEFRRDLQHHAVVEQHNSRVRPDQNISGVGIGMEEVRKGQRRPLAQRVSAKDDAAVRG